MNDEEHRRQTDDSLPVLIHRLDALEKRVDTGFAHLDQRLDTLAYVRVETWHEREAARDMAFINLKEDVKGTHTLAMWAVGMVAGLVLTSLVAFLVWIAQGTP